MPTSHVVWAEKTATGAVVVSAVIRKGATLALKTWTGMPGDAVAAEAWATELMDAAYRGAFCLSLVYHEFDADQTLCAGVKRCRKLRVFVNPAGGKVREL